MKTSDKGIELIQQFEGCRLQAYKDAVGVWTIGYGHIQGVHAGHTISQERADTMLEQDLHIFEHCVEVLFEGHELTQGQFDALVSFAFNLGCGALRRSTLSKKLLRGDTQGAANEFPKWCHAGHRKLKGLVRRRKAERELFLA